MADIQALRDRKVAALSEARAVVDAAEAEDRDQTEDESVKYDALLAEVESLNKRIARAEQIGSMSADIDDVPARRSVPDVPEAATNVRVVKEAFEDDTITRGFKTPREYLMSVMEAGRRPFAKIDARLNPLRIKAAAGSDEQSTFDDPHGGFAVPVGFSPTLLQIDPETDPIAGRTTIIPMANPRIEIPARVDKTHTSSVSGGFTVSRNLESVAGTTSRMSLEKVALQAASLFGGAYATEELLTDSPISFAAIIAAGFSQEFTSTIIQERLNGTGAGQRLGINNSPALVTVAKETSQAAATIVYNNVLKMRSRCWGYQNAIWLANHDCFPQLAIMNVAVGTAGGSAVYMPSAIEDRPDLLLGRSIFYTEYTETLGSAGDIILVNWTQYLEGLYQPLQSAESIHVRFLNNERTFKFWLRDAGTPWWSAALTPAKSSSTLSPYVRLAVRA